MSSQDINPNNNKPTKFIVTKCSNVEDNNFIYNVSYKKKILCPECNKLYYDKCTLKKHIKNVHNAKREKCIYCRGEFQY